VGGLSGLARVLGVVLLTSLAACSARYEWRELRAPDYVINLPGRWQTVTRDIDLAGVKVAMSMTSTGIGPSVFAVGVARLPAAAVADAAARDATFAYFRDVLVRNLGGKLVSEVAIDLPRVDRAAATGVGRAIVVSGRAGAKGVPARLAARLFIVDDRFYQVVAIAAEGEVPPEELETFFTSFRLLA